MVLSLRTQPFPREIHLGRESLPGKASASQATWLDGSGLSVVYFGLENENTGIHD
jgi:hypothetical protein